MSTTPVRRPTTADVAREAGVSRATVSYTLNGDPDSLLTEATKQRVLAAAERLGYVPSASARLLRGGRSNTVLMLSSMREGYTGQMGRMLEALAAELAGRGLSLVWQLAAPGAARPVGELSPGVVITAPLPGDALFADFARGFDAPVVPAFPGRDAFVAGGTRSQVAHLASRASRFVYLDSPDPELAWARDLRRAAAREEVAALNAPLEEVVLPAEPDEAAVVLRDHLRDDRPAVLAYNDEIALRVLSVAGAAGVSAPEDFLLIGADDIPAAALAAPPLTTVRPDLEAFAARFADDLQALRRDSEHSMTAALPERWTVVPRATA